MKSRILTVIMIGFLMFSITLCVNAAYPERTIELVAPHGFGGGWDMFGRSLALASRTDDANINVINKEGGGGTNAMNYVNNEPADGYTILGLEGSQLIGEATGLTELSTTEDFIPLMSCVDSSMGIFVKADSPYQTFDDLVEAVKDNTEDISLAGSDAGGIFNIVTLKVFQNAGTDVKYIPFESNASRMMPSFLGGHIDAVFDVASVFFGMMEAGEVRALAVTTKIEKYSDVPTFDELGYGEAVPGHWRGLAVKKGTPPEIVEYLKNLFKDGLKSDMFKTVAQQRNMIINIREGEELIKFMNNSRSTISDILATITY